MDPSGALSPAQVAQFREDGFLVVEGFADAKDSAALRSRAEQLVQDFDPATVSVFSTKEDQAHASSSYFYNSACNVSFFLEEKAFDETGQLRQPKPLSINKIGHALHDVDPVFRRFSRSRKIQNLIKSLGYKRPLPVQSMYIFKQPKIGGEVVAHQDNTFLYTDPPSIVGLWWALEDANRHNGCLWALKGVHKQGLRRRFIVHDGKASFDRPPADFDLSQFEPLECPAGTLVLLDGNNVHYSAENTSAVSRHAYSMHVAEGAPSVTWLRDNWAQRPPEQPWEPLYDELSSSSGLQATPEGVPVH